MTKWISKLFGSPSQREIPEWRTENSIFNFLSQNMTADGKLASSATDLPDEKRDNESIRYAPGLTDALFGADETEETKKRVKKLLRLAKKIAFQNGDNASEYEFYNEIAAVFSVATMIDPFLNGIVELELPREPFMRFGADLALRTNCRNAVKFGIAISGICQNRSIVNEIKTLALHDEFTVFAAVALCNLSDDILNDLWELAQKVDGWGKIQLVHRIVDCELSDQVKDWLLRDGYRNEILYEHLAYTCAVHGELHLRLVADSIDSDLFRSAGEIIAALHRGVPAEDLSDYEHAATAIRHYLRHAKKHADNPFDFVVLHSLNDALTDINEEIEKNAKNGWTSAIVTEALNNIDVLLRDEKWRTKTLEALDNAEGPEYWCAKQAAKKLGIDLWETAWKRLHDDHKSHSNWYDVVNAAKEQYVDQVVEYALKVLPLAEIATGPKDSLGFDENFDTYSSLDWVVVFLEDYPGKGESLILASLDSPTTSNRNGAIKTLKKWGKEHWSRAIEEKVRRLAVIEPNENTKKELNGFLNGEDGSV